MCTEAHKVDNYLVVWMTLFHVLSKPSSLLGYGQISLVVLKTSLLCKQIYMASENNDGQNEKKSFILLSLSSYVFLSSYSIVNFDSARSNSNEKLHQHILLSEQRLNLISTPSVFQRCKFFFFFWSLSMRQQIAARWKKWRYHTRFMEFAPWDLLW